MKWDEIDKNIMIILIEKKFEIVIYENEFFLYKYSSSAILTFLFLINLIRLI